MYTLYPTFIKRHRSCLLTALLLLQVFCAKKALSQSIAINTSGALPDSSAMLDIISANRGVLIPRVALASITDSATILHPAISLQVYNTYNSMTGGKKGFWYWNGNRWLQIIASKGADSLAIGSNITTPLLTGGTTTTSSITYKTTTATGTTGADHIFKVGTNGGTEALRILNNGNVGIGITNPTHLLHVNGEAFVPNKTGIFTAGSFTTISETGGGAGAIHGSNLKASPANNNKLYKSGSATEPGQYIAMRYDRGLYFGTGIGATDVVGTEYNDDANVRLAIGLTGTVGIGGTITSTTAMTGSNMTVLAAGNVGIGITAPSSKLNISNTINQNSINISHTTTSGTANHSSVENIANITPSANTSFFGIRNDVFFAGSQTIGDLNQGLVSMRSTATISGSATVENLTTFASLIQQTGTATVTNANGFRVRPMTNTDGSIANVFCFRADAQIAGSTLNAGFYGAIATGTGRYNCYMSGTAKNYFAGDVGIGTTTPGYKLDVQGGDINASGSVRSAGTALTSDRRFKLGIDSIQSALNIIDELKPRSYYFDTLNYNGEGKFNFCSQKQYGFIAQEVETILPELVVSCTKSCIADTMGNVTTPAYTYKTLNYNAFIPILTKGVQELQAQNAILQKQVSILEKRIQQLEGQ